MDWGAKIVMKIILQIVGYLVFGAACYVVFWILMAM